MPDIGADDTDTVSLHESHHSAQSYQSCPARLQDGCYNTNHNIGRRAASPRGDAECAPSSIVDSETYYSRRFIMPEIFNIPVALRNLMTKS